MKTSVYRFKLSQEAHEGIQAIPMPKGAEILKVGFTTSSLSMWAKVKVPDDGQGQPEMEERNFEMFLTGQELTVTPGSRREYIDSIIAGPLHLHVFELITVEPAKE